MCDKTDTSVIPLEIIDRATAPLMKLRALADLLSLIDPIELEVRTTEGISLIITECVDTLHNLITAKKPE
jgi:hypothetical protein